MYKRLAQFFAKLVESCATSIRLILLDLLTGGPKRSLKNLFFAFEGGMEGFTGRLESRTAGLDASGVGAWLSSAGNPPLRTGVQRLISTAEGLHSLLPQAERFGYSILIPVYHPKPQFLKSAVLSALNQSAPHMEILLGLDGPQGAEIHQVIKELQSSHPKGHIIQVVELDRAATGGGISRTTNALAGRAKMPFLLLMDHDDWLRPDLLLRYEQSMRLWESNQDTVLYCNEFKIDQNDREVPYSHLIKPEIPPFPYLFVNAICHCLLVPKRLWQQVGGLRPECDGAQDFDLCLRLDAVGAKIKNVPFFLYAWRTHAGSTAGSSTQKNYAHDAGIRALKDYYAVKGIDWSITNGINPTTYRGVPPLPQGTKIQAVMLYKDRADLTLPAIQSLLAQTIDGRPASQWLSILAVDNGSKDPSIAREIQSLGCQVLRIDEPFNFSRLCNLGAQHTQGNGTDTLLMINNDVFLDPGALEEMLRWVHQPKIGVVGCKLRYPSGKLQHGGVQLNDLEGTGAVMNWVHTEGGLPPEKLAWSNVMGVTDGVTAACFLVKRSTYEEVGGFDEQLYPIAYSDTNFCVKILSKGLLPFYSPFATGVHHESETRGKLNIEDYENSAWLERELVKAGKLASYPYIFSSKGFYKLKTLK